MKAIIILILVSLSTISCFRDHSENVIDLAGEWTFRTDQGDRGVEEKWYQTNLPETVTLPGSMTENSKGNEIAVNTPWTGSIFDSSWFFDPAVAKYRKPGNIKIPFWLQPDKYYKGAAWYQKKINIPGSWKDKFIQLVLERCHWETRIWVDEKEAGMQNSLATPHIYDLTGLLASGEHTITICVDNRIKEINVGQNSHSITDHTQSNWNGIAGKMELRARPAVYVSDVRLYPDIQSKKVRVSLMIGNITGNPVRTKIVLQAGTVQKTRSRMPDVKHSEIIAGDKLQEVLLDYPMGDNPLLWDEFHPHLYRMHIQISGTGHQPDVRDVVFGIREISTRGTQITMNGRPIFLRGTLECAIFPETGYPPTDTASWMRIFRIARAHGLNHMRFHSWCPPEAAFTAADHAGFYLHIECSSWANWGTTLGDGAPVDKFIYDEGENIVREYGNHPSFCIMLYGNEPGGSNHATYLANFVDYWKNKDPRRLYSSGAGWPVLRGNDFNNIARPRIQGWGQGLKSIINAQPPRTDYDWYEVISQYDIPTVSHEIGQWCVYPDFKEIPRYTGVLRARNFEIFKETLESHRLGNLADSFLLASGKLQALCYKADIEAALRTPAFGGFQLLDLHDFPGQGTALVGILNAFWEEKGYIAPAEFSNFCNSTVPLVRLPKMVYRTDEILKAKAEVAHFGEKTLAGVIPVWKLTDKDGETVFKGQLPRLDIPSGKNISLGEINQDLADIGQPKKLTLKLKVNEFENSWDIWVYPALPAEADDHVLLTQTLNNKDAEYLKNGGKVLLTVKKGSIKPEKGGDIAVGFSSIFWNTAWTNGQPPHTLGILCNPDHPAFNYFPTEYHSNWQWWDAMSHSNAVLLTDFPADLIPIVRIIDDWFTGRSLALIFEVSVGKGKLIFSGADLLTDSKNRPEAGQLLYSLKKYMASDAFNPTVHVGLDQLRELLD